MTTSDEHDDQHDGGRASQFRSLVALAWVALLVAGAVWLVNHITANNRLIACIESGHSNCEPVKINDSAPPETTRSPSIDRLRHSWPKSNLQAPSPPR